MAQMNKIVQDWRITDLQVPVEDSIGMQVFQTLEELVLSQYQRTAQWNQKERTMMNLASSSFSRRYFWIYENRSPIGDQQLMSMPFEERTSCDELKKEIEMIDVARHVQDVVDIWLI